MADARIEDTASPKVSCTLGGERVLIEADFIAGCDGFHGISRDAIPAGVGRVFEKTYPFGWVGILVSAPPSTDLVTYAWHERGFALSSMRNPAVTRLYVQCDHDDTMEAWPERTDLG